MMSNASITAPTLTMVRRDLDEAKAALGVVWTADDHDAIGRLTNAAEALMRATASLSLAVERLAELPQCEGGH